MTCRGVMITLVGVLAGGIIGWVIFPLTLYSSAPQPFRFSHKVHAGDQGMTCDMCHQFADDGRFLGIPETQKCGECHSVALGTTKEEATLVEEYIAKGRRIPWHVYSRLPDNAFFSHAAHVKEAGLGCEACHGSHGNSDSLRVYEANRITGESRDVWGRNISGIPSHPWETRKMDRCVRCHAEHNHAGGCVECHK